MVTQLSCNPNTTSDFSMTLAADKFILLDTVTTSCYGLHGSVDVSNDISAIYFSAPQITFNWSKGAVTPTASTKTLTIHWVSFKLSGGQLTTPSVTTIGGDQLLYSYYGASVGTSIDVRFSTLTGSNACPFKVGGINMPDKGKNSDGTVTITAYATYQDGTNTIPITAKKFAQYHYEGTGN